MAYPGKVMHNSKTRVTTRFVRTAHETNGKLLEMEVTYGSHSHEPLAHYHPCQSEDFEVLAGEITVRMEGEVRVLKQGDKLFVPANTPHSMWNNTDQETCVRWKVHPALNTEFFLETVTGLANDGKTNAAGTPGLLQTAVLALRFSPVFRLQRPPYALLQIIFTIMAPIAWMMGYRPVYSKYIN
jgi:quercetin dioxygenase-like cupin family protein